MAILSRMTLAELQEEIFQLTECGAVAQLDLDLANQELKRRRDRNRQGNCVCPEFHSAPGTLRDYCGYEGIPIVGHDGRTGFDGASI